MTQARKVAIYGSRNQEGFIPAIRHFITLLKEAGIDVAVERKLAGVLSESGFRLPLHHIETAREFPADANHAVSIGGDGTFLRTARWLAGRETPILGINTGHLGYLADHDIADCENLVTMLKNGAGKVDRRFVLKVSSANLPEGEWKYALNEVAFLKSDGASMISVRMEVDGEFLADYRADGLLAATPTGSTAYNLSVGGPILAPTLRNIILSPIAPHTLTLRPVVLGGDSRLKAVVTGRSSGYRLSIDGKSFPMNFDSEVYVERADHCVLTLHSAGSNFASTLRGKLLWGQSLHGE